MRSLAVWTIKALATCSFLTYWPARWKWGPRRWTGAGLIGSLAGLASSSILVTDPLRCSLILLGGMCLAVAVSDYAEELLGHKDDPRIVIDEWIGCWCAVAFLPHQGAVLILGFLLFRLFDVLKPAWIERAGNLRGGWGIVLDDVLAGAAANGCLQVLNALGRRLGYF